MDKFDFDRFVAVCGMLGSAHDGERANAAAFAEATLRRHGLTWRDVLREPDEAQLRRKARSKHDDMLVDLVSIIDELPSGRAGFINGCRDFIGRLSPKQRKVIAEIHGVYFGEGGVP